MDKVLYTETYDTEIRRALLSPETSFGLACWLLACGEQAIPKEAELARRLPVWIESDLIVVACDGDDDFIYERYGATSVALTGYDMTGKRVSEFQGPLRDFFHSIFKRALGDRIPLATVHRLGHFNERPIWERVILPVERNGAATALYMINRARKLGDDISQVRPRGKGHGLLLLQFLRREGVHVDAVIVGANQAARCLTGRRLDELLDQSMLSCFPGIIGRGLWAHYIEVAEARSPRRLLVDYCADGLAGVYDVEISPFRDGVAIDFVSLTDPTLGTVARAPAESEPAN